MSAEVGDFLRRNRSVLVAKWEAKVRASLPADASLKADTRRDSRHLFLDGVIEALAHGRGSTVEEGRTAIAGADDGQRQIAGHGGAHRVRECGLLLASVVELAEEKEGAALGGRELLEIATCLFSGAAAAVEQHAEYQEEQQRRSSFAYFAYVVHELGSPLAAVRLGWDLISRTGELDASSCEILTRSLAQLTELIEHSATLLQVASGVDAGRERVQVDELVADTLAASIVDADAKRIRIDVDALPLVVEADHRLLRFAVTNLLRNAVRFTREGGGVAIRSRLSEHGVLIEVEDGRGESPTDGAEQLFSALEAVSRDHGEFGPDLASSKQVMETHGGTLRVKHVPGRGCIFTIELPDPDRRAGD